MKLMPSGEESGGMEMERRGGKGRVLPRALRWLSAMAAVALLAGGCGADSSPAAEAPRASEESAAAAEEASAAETLNPGDRTEGEAPLEGGAEDPAESPGAPLYQRLCGKYSRRRGADEYDILEIISFGDNLYAFGGEAVGDVGTEWLEPYSFWAMELLPEDADALRSTAEDGCRVGILTFSIMSNFGKYWGPPSVGTILLEQDGVSFAQFDSAFPFGEGQSRVAFAADGRVEDTFPYRNTAPEVQPDAYAGYWREKGGEVPLYLEFTDDRNLFVYKKAAAEEVRFGCGAYEISDEGFLTCRLNLLGSGTAPEELEASVRMEGDTLIWRNDTDSLESLFGAGGTREFERISPENIPVLTLADAAYGGD